MCIKVNGQIHRDSSDNRQKARELYYRRKILMKNDMRVAVTERMLREGMLRCLEERPLSKISVSELCREAGVNRATFYNHYDAPVMILKKITREYAETILSIYNEKNPMEQRDRMAALRKCFCYIADNKPALRILFSENSENYLAGTVMEIINEKVAVLASSKGMPDRHDEFLLRASTAGAAAFGFIETWIMNDIDKTPDELVEIMKKAVTENVFGINV